MYDEALWMPWALRKKMRRGARRLARGRRSLHHRQAADYPVLSADSRSAPWHGAGVGGFFAGPEALSAPAEIFTKAETFGLLSELESVCRSSALRTIARLPSSLRSRSFFIKVSPNAPATRTCAIETCGRSREVGLDQRNFVVEIAERESVINYAAFERQIQHYVEQGFKVALDTWAAMRV